MIGLKIRVIRAILDVNQVEFAHKLGGLQGYDISRIEKGKFSPSPEVVQRINQLAGMELDASDELDEIIERVQSSYQADALQPA